MEMLRISVEQAKTHLEEKFLQNRPADLLVTGTSMVPFLRHEKDHVQLVPPSGDFRVGQILLFSMGDRLILHRLRKKRDGNLVMNGDGQCHFEVIRPEQVVAVATHVIRRSGRVISCNSLGWWLLSALWYPTRPLRPRLLRLAAGLKSVYCKLRK